MLKNLRVNSTASFDIAESRLLHVDLEPHRGDEWGERFIDTAIEETDEGPSFTEGLERMRMSLIHIDEDIDTDIEEGNIYKALEDLLLKRYQKSEAEILASLLADGLSDNVEFSGFGEEALNNPSEIFSRIAIEDNYLVLYDTNNETAFSAIILNVVPDLFREIQVERWRRMRETREESIEERREIAGEEVIEEAPQSLEELLTETQELYHQADEAFNETREMDPTTRAGFDTYRQAVRAIREFTRHCEMMLEREDVTDQNETYIAEGLLAFKLREAALTYRLGYEDRAGVLLDQLLTNENINDFPEIRDRAEEFARENEIGLPGARTEEEPGEEPEEETEREARERPSEREEAQEEAEPTREEIQEDLLEQTEEVREFNEDTLDMYSEFVDSGLLEALENTGTYTFDLPEEFQERYNRRRLERLFANRRIENADHIMDHLHQLGVNLDEFAEILNYERGHLERGRLVHVSQFLSYGSHFPEESFDEFIERTQALYEIRDEIAPSQEQELLRRLQVFQNINQLRHRLENLEMTEIPDENIEDAIEIDPDNVTQCRVSDTVRDQLRDLDVRNMFRGGKAMTLMAIYIYMFGPLERLLEEGHISVEQRGENVRRQDLFRLTLENITDRQAELIAEIYDRYGNVDGQSGVFQRHRTLTDAFHDLQDTTRRNNRFEEFTNFIYNIEVVEAETDSEYIEAHIRHIFDIQITGPYRRRGREMLAMHDLIGGEIEEGEVSDFVRQQISDHSMYNYLMNEVREHTDEGVNYDLAALAVNLSEYIRRGKVLARLNPEEAGIDPELLSEIPETITPDDLRERNFRLSDEQVQLIRFGIIHEVEYEQIQAESRESQEEVPGMGPMYENIYAQWLEAGVPTEQIPIVTQRTIALMAGLDLRDEITPEDFSAGALFNFRFNLYRDENGEIQVSPESRDDAGTYFSFGLGSATEYERAGESLFDIDLSVGVTQRFEDGGVAEVGASFDITNPQRLFTVFAGGGFTTERRGLEVSFGAGMRVLGVLPYGWANIEVGRSVTTQIYRSIERTAEESELADLNLDSQTMVAIARNPETVGDQQMLDWANKLDVIVEVVNMDPNFADLTPEQQDTMKIEYFRMLVTTLVNEGIYDFSGVGWSVGVAALVAPGLPVPVLGMPYVSIRTAGRRIMHYSSGYNRERLQGISRREILNQMTDVVAEDRGDEEVLYVVTDDGEIIVDSSGRRRVILLPEDQLQEFDPYQINHMSSLDQLNEEQETTGMQFEYREDLPEGFNYAFSIADYTTGLEGYASNILTEIFVDPTSGFTIAPIEGEPNTIAIRWGASADSLPPADLRIVREELTDPYGQNPTEVSLVLSRGHVSTVSDLINHPLVTETVVLDENGNTSTRENYGSYEAHTWGDPTDFEGYTFEVADYRPEVLEGDLNELGPMSERFLNLISEPVPENAYTPSEEIQGLVNELLGNEEFLLDLAEATTHEAENPADIPLDRLAELIRDNLPEGISQEEFTTQDFNYLIGRLIPGTYLTLENIDADERVEHVNNVIENIVGGFVTDLLESEEYGRRYNEDGELVEFTSEEIESIRSTIVRISRVDENNETLIEAITNNTEENLPEELLRTNLFTTAALRGMEADGFREWLYNEESMPSIVQGSLIEYDIETEDERLVMEFLYNLSEPPFEYSPNMELSEFLENEEGVTEMLTSETALRFLSLQVGVTENGEPMSLYAFILAYANMGEQIEFIEGIFEGLNERPPRLELPETLTEEQEIALGLLIRNIHQMRSTPLNNEFTDDYGNTYNVRVVDNLGNMIAGMNTEVMSGSMLIQPCGNLSFYMQREYGGPIALYVPRQTYISGRSNTTYLNELGQGSRGAGIGFDAAALLGPTVEPTQPEPEPEPEPGKQPTPDDPPDIPEPGKLPAGDSTQSY